MVKLLDLDRTATFAISNHNLPYLATANVAGAIDADFSDSAKLEIWNPFSRDSEPVNSVEIDSKVYDLTWSADSKLLVGGLEKGTVQFWDGQALIDNKKQDLVVHSANNHTSSVRSLAFNHTKSNVLISGSANSEIYIWDTNKLTADPMTPTGEPFEAGKKNLDEISSLAWNHKVSHIFASASSSGITSIWDLKSKRKVLNISYTATTNAGNIRANLSSVTWHPSQSTKLITGSDLDSLPVVLQWDLRFSKTPELIFAGPKEFNTDKSVDGHSKGILSIDWLAQDDDFLLTSGKDANTFLWNAKTGEKLASYPVHHLESTINPIGSNSSSDWVFKARFAHNPEYFANATFDGKVIFQTLQDANQTVEEAKTKPAAKKETSETDFWNQISTTDGVEEESDKAAVNPEIYVKKAPKWLKRPTTVLFAFGGKIVSVKTVADGDGQLSTVEINDVKLKEEKKSFDDLKAVLSGEPEKIDQLVAKHENKESFDWKLVEDLKAVDGDKQKLLKKHIGEPEETSDDFFSKLGDEEHAGSFKPEGKFQVFGADESETTTSLKKLVLSGDFSKAVSLCLENDKTIEALIVALNLKSEALKQKVLGHYFEHNINENNDSLARLLYATSSLAPSSSGDGKPADAINDLIENASVDNWKEIALGISTYVTDGAQFSAKITELGNRVYAAGSRDNALLLYFVSGALDSISEIWLKELAEEEKEIVKKHVGESQSLLDVYYKLLDSLIVKILLFKKLLGIDGELPGSKGYEQLVAIFLNYVKNIGDNYGEFELVGKLLSVLPSDLDDVKLGKARVAPKPQVTVNTGAGKYGKTKAKSYGAKASLPATLPPTSSATLAGPGIASPSTVPAGPKSKYAPAQTYTAPVGFNTYGPPADNYNGKAYTPPVKSNGYGAPVNQFVGGAPTAFSSMNEPPAPPQSSRYSLSQNPSKIKKPGHEGWNDLPDVFSDVTSKGHKKKAAPVAVSSGFNAPHSQPPPSFSRQNSLPVNGPPPPKGRGSSQNSALNSPRVANVALNSKYAPPPLQTLQSPLQQFAPPNRVLSPPPVNPYAPPPSQFTNVDYKPGFGAPSGNQFGAPPGNQFGAPAPGQFGAPPGNQFGAPGRFTPQTVNAPPQHNGLASPTAAQSLATQEAQLRSQPPAPTPPPISKTKHPVGDRLHISPEALPVFETLSREIAQVKPKIPAKFAKKAHDTETKLNVLFDRLNNQEVSGETVGLLQQLADALVGKDYDTAQSLRMEIATSSVHDSSKWITSVKKLIEMVQATDGM